MAIAAKRKTAKKAAKNAAAKKPHPVAAAAPTPTEVDVVIVGGGWTGTSAAVELKHLGVTNFVLLEADAARLGGRTYSHPDGAGTNRYEHGAQYFGEAQTAIWALVEQHALAERVDGFAVDQNYPMEVMVLDGHRFQYDRTDSPFGLTGVPPGLNFWELFGLIVAIGGLTLVERLIDVAEPWNSPLAPVLDGVTMAQSIQMTGLPPVVKSLLTISVQAVLSVEPSEVSAFYFLWYCACNGGIVNETNDEEHGPQQYYLSCGLDTLVTRVCQYESVMGKVEFGARVASIEVQAAEGRVVVTTQDNRAWRAKQVVVATAPRKALGMAYAPALSAERVKLMGQGMGRTIKCQVFYETPWWRDVNGLAFSGYAGGESGPVLWVMDYTYANTGLAALMVFVTGACADALGPNPSRADVEALVTAELAYLFGDLRALPGQGQYTGLDFYAWNSADPIAGGGPNTPFEPGLFLGANAPARLLNEPWQDRVWFASTETARKLADNGDPTSSQPAFSFATNKYSTMRQSLGYVDGAICEGRYVAHQVRDALAAASAFTARTRGPRRPPPARPAPPVPPIAAAWAAPAASKKGRAKALADAPDAPRAPSREEVATLLRVLLRRVLEELARTAPGPAERDWRHVDREARLDLLQVVLASMDEAAMPLTMEYLHTCVAAGWGYYAEALAGASPDARRASAEIKWRTDALTPVLAKAGARRFGAGGLTPLSEGPAVFRELADPLWRWGDARANRPR